MNTEDFKERSQVAKKLATQLSNLEERSEIHKIDIGVSTSMDIDVDIYTTQEYGSLTQSSDVLIETGFFSKHDDSSLLTIRDLGLPQDKTFGEKQIDVREIQSLEKIVIDLIRG